MATADASEREAQPGSTQLVGEAPRRSRRLRTALLFLLVGLLMSALVAAASAIWTPAGELTEMEPRAGQLEWGAGVPAGWPRPTARTLYESAVHTVAVYQAIEYAGESARHPGTTHAQGVHRFGWPARSFELHMNSEWHRDSVRWATSPVTPWLQPSEHSLGILPLRPRPGGLALDAALFGAVAWSLWRIVGALRRTRSMRAGRCPACGYRCSAAEGCPECGWNRAAAGE